MAEEADRDVLCSDPWTSSFTGLQGLNIGIEEFCQRIPKIELHAHLSGSVPDVVVQQLLAALLATDNKEMLGGVVQGTALNKDTSSIRSGTSTSDDCSPLQELTEPMKDNNAQQIAAGSNSGKSHDTEWQFTIEKKGKRRTMEECFTVFRALHRAINSLAALSTATRAVLDAFHADNVIYLELRSTPRSFSGTSKRDYMDTLVQTVTAWRQERPDAMTVRLVVSLDRGRPLVDAQENLEVALQMAKEQESSGGDCLLVGVDVSGDPTKNDLRALLPLMMRAKEARLGLLVHACEVLNDRCHAEILAVLQQVSVDRLGHASYVHCDKLDHYCSSSINSAECNKDSSLREGYDVGWVDTEGCFSRSEDSLTLEQLVQEKMIPIEACLSSNLCSGTCPAANQHHFQRWFLERGHPVCVCTDDCGVFQTTLSKEFTALTEAFSLEPRQLQLLVENAASAALLPARDKELLLDRIREHFTNLTAL